MTGYIRIVFVLSLLAGGFAIATAEPVAVNLVINDSHFSPRTLELPADIKVLITVENRGNLPAEFESYDLSREIVVPPGDTVKVYVGPLKPGKYHFFNDFNQDAEGWITVKPAVNGD